MQVLNSQELNSINGGVARWVLGTLGIGIVFLASVIYGMIYPNKC